MSREYISNRDDKMIYLMIFIITTCTVEWRFLLFVELMFSISCCFHVCLAEIFLLEVREIETPGLGGEDE